MQVRSITVWSRTMHSFHAIRGARLLLGHVLMIGCLCEATTSIANEPPDSNPNQKHSPQATTEGEGARQTIPEYVVKAWQAKGFWFNPGDEPPSFSWEQKWEPGVVSKLPDPGVPFKLLSSAMRDEDLKELAGLRNLTHLTLEDVTDAGLSELAGVENLTALSLSGAPVHA